MARLSLGRFRIAGLTHLTAVSGANVTIVCAAALLAAALVGPRLAALLALAVLIGFVVVVEPSASVLRAAVMGGVEACLLLASAGETGDQGRRHLIYESSDVIYHLLVLLAHHGIKLQEVEAEIARRFVQSGLDEKAARPVTVAD